MAICAALKMVSIIFFETTPCHGEHPLIACLEMYSLILMAVIACSGMDIDAAYVFVGRATRGFACLYVDMGYSIYRCELTCRDRHGFVC
jgi:hypothetical protein